MSRYNLERVLEYFFWLCHGEKEMTKQAQLLGVHLDTFKSWWNTPAFKVARTKAEEFVAGQAETFGEYVFRQLTPEAQKVWKRISKWADPKKRQTLEDQANVHREMKALGRKIRQELFIHALIYSNYNLSEACRITGVSYNQLNGWRREDTGFKRLVEEVEWHKKNFFEHALMDLVAERHPTAVLFVNRTINADRGYSERMTVNHTGLDPSFGLEDLDLDLETRKRILEAIRRKKEKEASSSPIIDVTPQQLTNGEPDGNGENGEDNAVNE